MSILYDLMRQTAFATATVDDGYNGATAEIKLCLNASKVYELSGSGYNWSGIEAESKSDAVFKCCSNPRYKNLTVTV